MPEAPERFIPSAPVRIGETIYVQNKNNKLFSFDIDTKKWQVCDGMDISKCDEYPNKIGANLPKYIGAKYVSSSSLGKNRDTEVGGDQPGAVSSAVDN